MTKFLDTTGLEYFWEQVETRLNDKVPSARKVNDKELSTDITLSAEDLSYDNTSSGLTATDIQSAIDELASEGSGGFAGGDASTLDGYTSDYFATAESVTNIVNGSTLVGNADKLDGHDSEYFAASADLANYVPTDGSATQNSVGRDGYIAYANKVLSGVTFGIAKITPPTNAVEVSAKVIIFGYIGGNYHRADYYITGYWTGTAWGGCTCVSVGGETIGNLSVGFCKNSDGTPCFTIGSTDTNIVNAKCVVTDLLTRHDYATQKNWDIQAITDFTNITVLQTVPTPFIGANYFKNTGGTVTGEFKVRKADNGYVSLNKNHSATADYGTILKDVTKDGTESYVEINTAQNKFRYKDTSGTLRDILHSGNVSDHALPKTGGDVTGNINIHGNRSLQFWKADGTRSIALYSAEGVGYGINSSFGQDWVMLIPDNGGTPTFNGTASGNVPLDGGGTVSKAYMAPVVLKNTSGDVSLTGYYGASGELGYLGFNGVGNPICQKADGTKTALHHDGNSSRVQVVAEANAPTEGSTATSDYPEGTVIFTY